MKNLNLSKKVVGGPGDQESLLNVINRKEKLPPGLLTDLLKKNLPLEKDVLETVLTMKPALPLKNMRELEQAQNQAPLYPKLKVLEKEWHLNKGDIRHLENEMVSVLLRNKMNEKREEIILENRCEKNDKWLAELQIDKKQFNEARTTLNEIQQESIEDTLLLDDALARINLKENLNYCKLLNCLINVFETERDIHQLTTPEIEIIKEVAYAKTPSSVKAELILEDLGIEFFEHPIKKDRKALLARKGKEEELSELDSWANETKNIVNKIMIYPNPAQTQIYFDFNISEDNENKVEIYTIIGQKIFTLYLKNNAKIILPESIHKGIYFYKLFANNSLVQTGKIIIQK